MKKPLVPLVLSYAGCSTCKKALKWLETKGVSPQVRPIVEQPPTTAELKQWVGKSKKPVKAWLNTSGLSYRALGKHTFESASEAEVIRQLAADGKLVKRPVLVLGETVLVGFKQEEWEAVFR